MDNNQPSPPLQQPENSPVEGSGPAANLQNNQGSKKRTLLLVGGFLTVIMLFGYGIFLFVVNNRTSSSQPPQPRPSQISPTIPQSQITQPPDPEDGSFDMILQKAKKVPIQDSNVNITYVGADIPNPNCFDCSQTTDIMLENLGEEIKLGYLCGGIAGTCTDKLSGFGFEIELKSADSTSATVRIRKQ